MPPARPRFVDRLEDCFFYHAIDLPGVGSVPGQWDLRGRFDDYVGGVDVGGRSVLDIGTATGFLSFESERRGATRVASFDMSDVRQQTFLPFKDKPAHFAPELFFPHYGAGFEKWKNAYWLSHRLLRSRVEAWYGDVYDVPAELGGFDVVLVGSVLEHLSDPITALASITRRADDTLVIVTPMLDRDDAIAEFAGRADNPGADYTWWVYSRGVYREVLAMLGFAIAKETRNSYEWSHGGRAEERTTLVAVRTGAPPA